MVVASLFLSLQTATIQTALWDPAATLERTCFQTDTGYSDRLNVRGDVAIVYGFNNDVAGRVAGWRNHGYRVHLMTGVAWGEYQDYLYGRFDGVNHEDEVQQQANGEKIGHGGDVYYMSPGKDYGRYLCLGVQKALDAGVEAIHLEEPEFWVRGGYAAGFKREWQDYYHEPWQAPDSSPDARWRASKLMYFLYRRALTQVFDYVKAYDQKTGRNVRCYVPTHSLLNYASWQIVSPESSLSRIDGCDGYIAQVWTGTARTPNVYNGVTKERTFETAFLEYGAMQNLVRATGRRVWYLADPVEDNPDHDWGDYRRNYEATVTASLLQPDVWRYEIMPWPNRIFTGKYPSETDPKVKVGISDAYTTELQRVTNALKDMNQKTVSWEGGTEGIGFVVGDSLMFERGNPTPSDGDMSHMYGLALPFVKRGIPIAPIQLENLDLPHYLDRTQVLLMTYEGMKPLSPNAHVALAAWVRQGGRLVFVDDDKDPYSAVREWWNSDGFAFKTPRQDLFARLRVSDQPGYQRVGRGGVYWLKQSPSALAHDPAGSVVLPELVQKYGAVKWKTAPGLLLRRGPYVVAAGLNLERANDPGSSSPAGEGGGLALKGRYLDLFSEGAPVRANPTIAPDQRAFMIDLSRLAPGTSLVAAAGSAVDIVVDRHRWSAKVQGIAEAPCELVLKCARVPKSVVVDHTSIPGWHYDPSTQLLWIRFAGSAQPRAISVEMG